MASSTGDRIYTVFVSPWSSRESICECDGYRYRGTCRHQDLAAEQVCRWSELTDKAQTEEEHELRICPRCGGETRYEIDVR